LNRQLSIITSMGTVQIVFGKELLRATDRAARRRHVNRSALVREAVREHLKKLATKELEDRDRAGYEPTPVEPGEFSVWDGMVAWSED
jgi:Arc/MetJ-type ribon-helix-helix transcriptional regulator